MFKGFYVIILLLLDIKSNLRERKKHMKRILGFLLLVVAIIGGLYVGGWLFFVKAIVDVIEAVKAGFVAMDIAIAIGKMVIGVPIVEVIALVLGTTGVAMMVSED